jgi:hypothetical protein
MDPPVEAAVRIPPTPGNEPSNGVPPADMAVKEEEHAALRDMAVEAHRDTTEQPRREPTPWMASFRTVVAAAAASVEHRDRTEHPRLEPEPSTFQTDSPGAHRRKTVEGYTEARRYTGVLLQVEERHPNCSHPTNPLLPKQTRVLWVEPPCWMAIFHCWIDALDRLRQSTVEVVRI